MVDRGAAASRTRATGSRRALRALAVASLALAAACERPAATQAADAGVSAAAPVSEPPAPSAELGPRPEAASSARASVFYADEEGRVHPEPREVAKPAVLRGALDALFRDAPKNPRLKSMLPERARLLSVDLEGRTAILDVSREFAEAGMSSMQERAAIEQIGHTVTQFGNADAFLVRVVGRPFSGFGHFDWGSPLRPSEDGLALVVVDSPPYGASVGSPIRVLGTARVFEATVSWKLEQGGRTVRVGHTMASEGAPGRGRFAFSVEAPPGRCELVVYESSAKDGAPLHVVRHRLTVVP